MIAPVGLKVGQKVMSGKTAEPEVGNTLYLRDVPLGTSIHAIELHPHQGAALARSAGTYAELTGKEDRYAVVKMPSGEVRRILLQCRATIGTTSNPVALKRRNTPQRLYLFPCGLQPVYE